MASQKNTYLSDALNLIRGAFLSVAGFSCCINLLMLVPVIYMLQVYDRVVTSGSLSTLLMLTLIMVALLIAMGCLEWCRSKILIRAGARFDRLLAAKTFDVGFKQSLYSGGRNNSAGSIQDLNGLRSFLSGNALFAFFDAPWMPVYIGVMFIFHPLYGWVAVFSAIVLGLLALINEKLTRNLLQEAGKEVSQANEAVTRTLCNAEVIESMGMLGRLRQRWQMRQDKVLLWQSRAAERGASIASVSKTIRITVQSLILGLGAYLVIQQEITPGLMVAGSILLGRALAPIDQMIGAWKGFVMARSQYNRLRDGLQKLLPEQENMALPTPSGEISIEHLSVTPPGAGSPILKDISLQASPGEVWGILGPSGAGKSSLARALLGIWPPSSGKVRLDHADIFTWDREALGAYVGYLPQDIELFDGTVSENISRFGDVDPEQVVRAAQIAGMHEMILSFHDGYDTRIGKDGMMLSGGQRQRLGLARAIYGSPVLLVLDEPNSNLDDLGEQALTRALQTVKQQGTTVFIITHRPSVLGQVDKLIMLANGAVQLQGPRDEVLSRLKQAQAAMQQAAPNNQGAVNG
ncbi:type I secretion system permease/ATPase [Aliamphritea ceti]|uniref:type I secretion system permease/ATPase n=1 Tax=Aliamphritea ceti TaxID=1524258 RepID=UPI0021C3521A|nr:type I secretion system permease/ATPase [Aliamphritea ceti]